MAVKGLISVKFVKKNIFHLVIEEENMYMNKEAIVDEDTKGTDTDEEDAPGGKRGSTHLQPKRPGGGMGFGNIISAGILSGTKLRKVHTSEEKKSEKEEKKSAAGLAEKGASLKPVVWGFVPVLTWFMFLL